MVLKDLKYMKKIWKGDQWIKTPPYVKEFQKFQMQLYKIDHFSYREKRKYERKHKLPEKTQNG